MTFVDRKTLLELCADWQSSAAAEASNARSNVEIGHLDVAARQQNAAAALYETARKMFNEAISASH